MKDRKLIDRRELALILAKLLINPAACGELENSEKFEAFMLDIGQVVADYCGGNINGVSPVEVENIDADVQTEPMLSVSPNGSLPSLLENIWAGFDEGGWSECPGIELGVKPTEKQIDHLKQQITMLKALIASPAPNDSAENYNRVMTIDATISDNHKSVIEAFCFASQNKTGLYDEPQTIVSDMLCNVVHYCHHYKLSFDLAIALAGCNHIGCLVEPTGSQADLNRLLKKVFLHCELDGLDFIKAVHDGKSLYATELKEDG